MGSRYSVLRPLTTQEQEMFAIQLLNFFFPLNYKNNCQILGITANEKSIKPFSLGDLLKFLKSTTGIEAHKYMYHLNRITQKFTSHGLIVSAGIGQGSPPFNQCYYSQFELTELQKTNNFWLGIVLGEEFLKDKFKPLIVRFEGEYSDGTSGTGSGILINDKTILTCRHNLTDLNKYNCYIDEAKLEIEDHVYHDIHDIGVVRLSQPQTIDKLPYFGKPIVLDNTLTLGYPPLRGMREAPLISQKGEVNAISKDWQNSDCITISSTVRPGNSGGPVVSSSGYIIGIVTQFANSAKSVSANKDEFQDDHSIPFYNALASTAIREIIPELDNSIIIPFEDYQ